MDGSKRLRTESRNYNEKRNYSLKRPRSDFANVKKKAPNNTLIMDNGAYSIKIGYTRSSKPINFPNHIMKAKSERKRCFVSDQIEDCRDLSGLYYIMPHEHGYISKFDVQKTVWDYVFGKYPLDDRGVILTQPILNFRHVQEYTDEIFYEEYDVKSLCKANPTDLSFYQYITSVKGGDDTACLVVDSGYSFTHIVPYINGKKYAEGIIRMDVGGKLLTNYLKDILSYRQLHVMEETYVINQVKEDTCFMSKDFKGDMKRAKTSNDIVQNYVLPDFHYVRRGYVQDASKDIGSAENCQILRLNNERISVPEILMMPSLVPGLEQCGIAQCIAKSISRCPTKYRKGLAANVVLTGGNCMFANFKERIQTDVRMLLPCEHRLSVFLPNDPISYAWKGGQSLSQDSNFSSYCVTKQEYEDCGSSYTYEYFNDYVKPVTEEKKKAKRSSFSYLEHWKNEGVDIFNKSNAPQKEGGDLEFILEGDDIEKYDGQHVTVDLEIEKPVEAHETIPTIVQTTEDEEVEITEQPVERKNVITMPPLASISKKPLNYEAPTTRTFPIFRSLEEAMKGSDPNTNMTQIVKLSGSNFEIRGNSLIVPGLRGPKHIISKQMFGTRVINKAVLLPPFSKKMTLQLIPFKPEMLRQGANIVFTKKQ